MSGVDAVEDMVWVVGQSSGDPAERSVFGPGGDWIARSIDGLGRGQAGVLLRIAGVGVLLDGLLQPRQTIVRGKITAVICGAVGIGSPFPWVDFSRHFEEQTANAPQRNGGIIRQWAVVVTVIS